MIKQVKKKTSLTLLMCISLLTVLCLSGVAQAQSQSGEEFQGQAQTQVSDQEATSFANAFNAVREIQKQYSQEIQGVQDESQIKKLQQKYTDKMINQVENNGLSVDRYNEIAQAMQRDESLRQKIEKKMESLQ
jgi:preprotein translocase subunit SecF